MALERVERRKMRLWLGPAQFRPAHQVRYLATEAAIAQQRRHIGVAGEAPEAVVLPEEHGRSRVDRGIGAIGIVEKAGVARVEPQAAPRGVYRWRHGRPYGKGRWKEIVIVWRGQAPVYRANRTKSDKILLIIRRGCYRARCRLILTSGTGWTRGGLALCCLILPPSVIAKSEATWRPRAPDRSGIASRSPLPDPGSKQIASRFKSLKRLARRPGKRIWILLRRLGFCCAGFGFCCGGFGFCCARL